MKIKQIDYKTGERREVEEYHDDKDEFEVIGRAHELFVRTGITTLVIDEKSEVVWSSQKKFFVGQQTYDGEVHCRTSRDNKDEAIDHARNWYRSTTKGRTFVRASNGKVIWESDNEM